MADGQPHRPRHPRLLSTAVAAATVGAVVWFLNADHGVRLTLVGGDNSKDSPSEDSVEFAKKTLLEADAVFFDVDSTVVRTEGIDLLGRCFGVMKEISELTEKAMNGNVRFQDAMAQRLQLMADNGMTEESLEQCVRYEGRPRWTPGIQVVVKALQVMGKDVYLVSGGFRNMIRPVAEALDIPDHMIFANTILFNKNGQYKGFNKREPTSRSGGKSRVLRKMRWKKGYHTMVMIGDGATDLEARTKGPAKAFIGFGGVSVREKVKAQSDWYITSFKEISAILPKVEA